MNEKSLNAVVIKNPLPADIVALEPELLGRALALASAAAECQPVDAESLEAGNGLFREIDELSKAISEARLVVTRPIDALKTLIIEAARTATAPLSAAKEGLGPRLLACGRRLQAERDEAERKARQAAEWAAAEERARLEAQRRIEMARLEAERQAEQERLAAEAALFGEPVAELPPVELPPIVAPVAEIIPAAIPAAPRAAVSQAVRKVLQITDEAAIIAEACKDGGKIHGRLVLAIDQKAVEALLKAGCPVPGAELQEVVSVRSAGRR